MSTRYVSTPRLLDPSWLLPLKLVEQALRELPTDLQRAADSHFDVHDFMVMGRVEPEDRPRVTLYKHIATRCYLNVDDTGQTYRFVPPRRSAATPYGTYRPHTSLRSAIDHLDLWFVAENHRAQSRRDARPGSPSAA